MPRPTKSRRIAGMPVNRQFCPKVPSHESVTLSMEELEVLRRIDGNGEDQEQAAQSMMVSRGTVQRLMKEARRKVAEALVEGKQIIVAGGNFEIGLSTGQTGWLRFGYNRRDLFMSRIIAVMAEGNDVSPHFGRSSGFFRFSVTDDKVVEKTYVDSSNHQHEGLPALLHAEGVDTVIAGGIGGNAVMRLEAVGLKLIAGVRGKVDDVIQQFLEGTLEPGDTSCGQHEHHGEHAHGQGHGSHRQGR